MHPLLRRQLRRVGLTDPTALPDERQWTELLDRVERTYTLADQDRYTLERSLDVSSLEMQQLYDDLRRSAESQLAKERDKLQQSLAIHHATLEAGIDGVLVVGVDRTILGHNRRFSEIWGIPDDVLATGSDSLLLRSVLAKLAEPGEFVQRVEYLYDHPEATSREEVALLDGRVIDRFSAPVLSDGLALGRVWFFRDITTRRRMEQALKQINDDLERRVRSRTEELEHANERLRQQVDERLRAEQALRQAERRLQVAQKMEAVDRLAGGIAHDFNNMLAVVISCSGLLEDLLQGQQEALEEVEQIQQASQRAADLTRQLLAFSRQQVLAAECVDLRDVARDVERMLARLLAADAELVVHAPDRKCRVLIDRGQLEQVLVNLIVNARDAMPDGGRITVTVRRASSSEQEPLAGGTARAYLAIDVEDDGVGMDAETQARMFEPFFTTKSPGKGTGLGLAMVYGIVRQSGGEVAVTSAPGQGTKLTVILPETDAESEAEVPSAPANTQGASATVLLVDDEQMVRAAARRILSRAGYHVIEAADADEARLHHAKEPHGIDLLLTDLVMPRTGGLSLASSLRELRPDLPVVFMSGHADSTSLEASRGAGAFLQKPFRPDQLLATVRSVL